MSTSITIPAGPAEAYARTDKSPGSSSSASSYSSPSTPSKMEKKPAHARRPSLLSMETGQPPLARVFTFMELTWNLGAAISKQECTVINISDPDEPARLVCALLPATGGLTPPGAYTDVV